MTDTGSSNNFWLFLEVLARRRSLIISIVFSVTILAVIISFILPKWYKASALLLPPKDVSLTIPGMSTLEEIVSVTKGLDLPIMVTPSDIYARILKSRTIAERVIDKFDLKTRFKADNFTEAYEKLMKRADFRVTDEGLLKISFEDKDPVLAAKVTNAFVDELDRINREIVTSRILQNRQFIEERLAQVKAELDSARYAFQQFQVANKAIDFNEQIRLAIEQAIKLKVQLEEFDIKIQMKEQMLSPDNTELVELRRNRQIIRNQLKQLENVNSDNSFFSLPIAAIPELRGQYEELYSKVRISESLYKILLEQLEHMKLQQQENTPSLSILDKAVPPEEKSKPKRTLIVVGAFGLSLLVAVFLAALLEYLRRMEQTTPEDYRRAMMFIQAFLGWLPGVKRTRKT